MNTPRFLRLSNIQRILQVPFITVIQKYDAYFNAVERSKIHIKRCRNIINISEDRIACSEEKILSIYNYLSGQLIWIFKFTYPIISLLHHERLLVVGHKYAITIIDLDTYINKHVRTNISNPYELLIMKDKLIIGGYEYELDIVDITTKRFIKQIDIFTFPRSLIHGFGDYFLTNFADTGVSLININDSEIMNKFDRRSFAICWRCLWRFSCAQ